MTGRRGIQLVPLCSALTPLTWTDCRVGSAVCSSKSLGLGQQKTFSFSLAWDNPIVRFGGGRGYTRFYSRSRRGSDLGRLTPFSEYSEAAVSRVPPWRPLLCYRKTCECPVAAPPLGSSPLLSSHLSDGRTTSQSGNNKFKTTSLCLHTIGRLCFLPLLHLSPLHQLTTL
jgi:hypothetical protein